jgi:hypothetical protein
MCLTKVFNITVAKEDITVYRILLSSKNYLKLLEKNGNTKELDVDRFQWVSPYKKSPVSIEEGQTSDLKLDKAYFYLLGYFKINVGIHSIKTLDEAQALLKCMLMEIKEDDALLTNLKIFEAVIPKGSRYGEGEFLYVGGTCKGYASNELKYIKEID